MQSTSNKHYARTRSNTNDDRKKTFSDRRVSTTVFFVYQQDALV